MYYIVLINFFLLVTGSLGVTGAIVRLVGWTAAESDRLYSVGQAGWSAKRCQALSARLMARVSLLMMVDSDGAVVRRAEVLDNYQSTVLA